MKFTVAMFPLWIAEKHPHRTGPAAPCALVPPSTLLSFPLSQNKGMAFCQPSRDLAGAATCCSPWTPGTPSRAARAAPAAESPHCHGDWVGSAALQSPHPA